MTVKQLRARTTRQVRLTPEGEALLPLTRRLLVGSGLGVSAVPALCIW